METNLPSIDTADFLIKEITKEAQLFTNSVALPHQKLLETFFEYVEEVDFIAEVYPVVLELRQKLSDVGVVLKLKKYVRT